MIGAPKRDLVRVDDDHRERQVTLLQTLTDPVSLLRQSRVGYLQLKFDTLRERYGRRADEVPSVQGPVAACLFFPHVAARLRLTCDQVTAAVGEHTINYDVASRGKHWHFKA